MSAAESVCHALRLLQAASPDWRHKGPTDGGESLFWPIAVSAAKAHLEHALQLLDVETVDEEVPAKNVG